MEDPRHPQPKDHRNNERTSINEDAVVIYAEHMQQTVTVKLGETFRESGIRLKEINQADRSVTVEIQYASVE